MRAARDPDGEVRNNATRALVVLARSNRALVDLIDASTFIAMLEKIRLEAWDSLWEMAAWRRLEHSLFARMILGRAADVDEVKLGEAAMAGPDFFSRLAPPVR